MKRYALLVLAFSLLFCTGVFAQTDLSGTWQGKLATSPNEKITIQFILAKQANGSYTAILNSPDTGGIKNVPATGVKLAGNVLTIDVASLSGSYSGTVAKGTIDGQWKQEGSTFPLVLAIYRAPAVSTLKPLVGDWLGDFTPPGTAAMKIVVHFEISKDGKFNAKVDVPEQGQMNTPVSDVLLEGNEVSFKIAGGQAEYTGKLAGNKIDGKVKAGGQEISLNLAKGKYEARTFSVPSADMKRLSGEWVGNTGPNKLTIVFRFEPTQSGTLGVFMDVPDQRVRGVAVKDFTLNGEAVTIKLPGPAGDTYTGTISANSMKGTFKLNNVDQELNLSKGKFGITEMPAEDMKRLLGQWVGKYAQGGPAYTIVWEFEKTADGKLRGLASAPETGPDELPMSNISLKGDQLSLRIPATGGDFTGKITGNSLSGSYLAGGTQLQMTVVRGAKYEKPTTQVEIPAETLKKLMGKWNGNIGALSVDFRFERTPSGKANILHDILSQNVKDMVVSKAFMKNADLLLNMPDGAEITLKLNGSKLEGTLKAGGTSLPVTLTKQSAAATKP